MRTILIITLFIIKNGLFSQVRVLGDNKNKQNQKVEEQVQQDEKEPFSLFFI
jgi:hypothetical protein